MLGEHPREPVGLLDQVVHILHDPGGRLGRVLAVAVQQRRRRVHVGPHAQSATRLLADGQLVTRDHLHAHSQADGPAYGLGAVVPGRVEERHQAAELPRPARALLALLGDLLDRDGQRAQPALGEFVNHAVDSRGDLVAVAGQRQDLLGRALGGAPPLAVAEVHVGDGGALVRRVEGQEVQLADARPRLARVLQGPDDGRVDGVLVLGSGGASGVEDDGLLVHAGLEDLDQVLVDGELVERQGAGLVAAEDVHAGHLLDGRHALGDGALRREVVRADGHGDREHGGHGDGDPADEQHQQVVDPVHVAAALDAVHDDDLHHHAAGDRADAEVADRLQHLLEVPDLVGAVDQVRGLAEEAVHARGDHHRLDLALLAGRARVHPVAGPLGGGQ
ncbi:hypothetical protein Mapa_007181 [Marchantia paleacea]|nr:hypothetical protein Mapa_007181 [Marchantia paleacea]